MVIEMYKKLLAAALVIFAAAAFASCSKLEPEVTTTQTETETQTESTAETSKEIIWDLPDLTAEDATLKPEQTVTAKDESITAVTEPSSVKEKVTETVTEGATKLSTTTAKAIAETTKKVTTTHAKSTTSAPPQGSKNKYGVIVYTGTSGNTIVDRFWYTGTYSELLPAAKANRRTYSGYISDVLYLTNKMRAEKGLSALTLSDKLTEQANVRAEEIAWSGKHSHTRPTGGYFSSLFKENGLTTGTAGENIGWGYETPSGVCNAWKESPTHYENIMNPDFRCIGIGVAADADPDAKLVWVQHFYTERVG